MTTPPTPPTWLDAYFTSGYTTVKELASLFPSQKILNFEGGGVTVTDDPINGQTIVTVGSAATASLTTASFTQPAVGSNVVVSVSSTSFLTQGMTVYIQGGGFYVVSSVTDGTHFVANNTGSAGNASPGATIASPALVAGSGPLPVPAGYGSPLVSSGGTLALSVLQRWGLFIAGDVVTIPSVLPPGLPFLLTHDQIRSGTSLAGTPVTIQRAGGLYVIQQPDGHQSGGVPLTASSVNGFTDGANYQLAFDGGSPGVVRCISLQSSP
jgi:hypothetical protein